VAQLVPEFVQFGLQSLLFFLDDSQIACRWCINCEFAPHDPTPE
jgi:hypothetical protein